MTKHEIIEALAEANGKNQSIMEHAFFGYLVSASEKVLNEPFDYPKIRGNVETMMYLLDQVNKCDIAIIESNNQLKKMNVHNVDAIFPYKMSEFEDERQIIIDMNNQKEQFIEKIQETLKLF